VLTPLQDNTLDCWSGLGWACLLCMLLLWVSRMRCARLRSTPIAQLPGPATGGA